jgi:hypothetical protein
MRTFGRCSLAATAFSCLTFLGCAHRARSEVEKPPVVDIVVAVDGIGRTHYRGKLAVQSSYTRIRLQQPYVAQCDCDVEIWSRRSTSHARAIDLIIRVSGHSIGNSFLSELAWNNSLIIFAPLENARSMRVEVSSVYPEQVF